MSRLTLRQAVASWRAGSRRSARHRAHRRWSAEARLL